MDRIHSLPRTRELRQEPDMPPLAELRKRIGLELSDEEFLLRATMPAEQVDGMKAGRARTANLQSGHCPRDSLASPTCGA